MKYFLSHTLDCWKWWKMMKNGVSMIRSTYRFYNYYFNGLGGCWTWVSDGSELELLWMLLLAVGNRVASSEKKKNICGHLIKSTSGLVSCVPLSQLNLPTMWASYGVWWCGPVVKFLPFSYPPPTYSTLALSTYKLWDSWTTVEQDDSRSDYRQNFPKKEHLFSPTKENSVIWHDDGWPDWRAKSC